MSPWSDIVNDTLCILSESYVLKSCERGGQLFKGTEEIEQFHEPTKSKGSSSESPGGLFSEKFSFISIYILGVSLHNGVQLPRP